MRHPGGLAEVITTVESAVAAYLADGPAPCLAVAIVQEGQPAWSHGFGVAEPVSGRPVTPDTLFRIASVTKPFTVPPLERSMNG